MPNLLTSGFEPGDDEAVISILQKWDGGVISDLLFTELARWFPQPIIEVVVFREHDGVVETLLIPRPEGDPVWAGKFHTPGTALRRADYYNRPDDKPLNGAFERVRRELGSIDFSHEPVFAGFVDNKSERGPGVTRVFWTQIPEDAQTQPGTKWVAVDSLPTMPEFIQAQMTFIPIAVKAYSNRNRSH